jgi:hypothetical protein
MGKVEIHAPKMSDSDDTDDEKDKENENEKEKRRSYDDDDESHLNPSNQNKKYSDSDADTDRSPPEKEKQKEKTLVDDNNSESKDILSVALKSSSSKQNFTVCAPQLLHLDTDGKPLWFNGWLLRNKFADKKKKKTGEFEVYMVEPKPGEEGEESDEDAWKLIDDNICCLTAEKTVDFSADERETLNMLVEMTKEAGAYGKG